MKSVLKEEKIFREKFSEGIPELGFLAAEGKELQFRKMKWPDLKGYGAGRDYND